MCTCAWCGWWGQVGCGPDPPQSGLTRGWQREHPTKTMVWCRRLIFGFDEKCRAEKKLSSKSTENSFWALFGQNFFKKIQMQIQIQNIYKKRQFFKKKQKKQNLKNVKKRSAKNLTLWGWSDPRSPGCGHSPTTHWFWGSL